MGGRTNLETLGKVKFWCCVDKLCWPQDVKKQTGKCPMAPAILSQCSSGCVRAWGVMAGRNIKTHKRRRRTLMSYIVSLFLNPFFFQYLPSSSYPLNLNDDGQDWCGPIREVCATYRPSYEFFLDIIKSKKYRTCSLNTPGVISGLPYLSVALLNKSIKALWLHIVISVYGLLDDILNWTHCSSLVHENKTRKEKRIRSWHLILDDWHNRSVHGPGRTCLMFNNDQIMSPRSIRASSSYLKYIKVDENLHPPQSLFDFIIVVQKVHHHLCTDWDLKSKTTDTNEQSSLHGHIPYGWKPPYLQWLSPPSFLHGVAEHVKIATAAYVHSCIFQNPSLPSPHSKLPFCNFIWP